MKFFQKLIKYFFLFIIISISIICIAFGKFSIPLETLKSKYANADSKFIEVDGLKVHYRIEGNEQDSIPLVLIHGTGSSLHTWEAWVAALKGEQQVITMDLPAYGLTGPNPEHDYSIEKYSDFIAHFLEKINVKKCDLGGNSLGGNISWAVALKYPNLVKKLILVDAAGYPLESKSVPIAFRLAKIPILNKAFSFITPRFIVENSIKNVFSDKNKVTAALIDRYFDLSLRAGNREAFVDRLANQTQNDWYQKISTIQQPTLILWGEDDFLIPTENAQRFHQDLPNDTLLIFKGLGHVPMEENPSETVKSVIAFLK
jgi:pimeloyl-ACP methyl ester carboxylesterase